MIGWSEVYALYDLIWSLNSFFFNYVCCRSPRGMSMPKLSPNVCKILFKLVWFVCLECLLKLLNFLMVVAGLGMIVYGIYLFVKYKRAPDDNSLKFNGDGQSYISFGRPMLRAVSLSSNVFDNLPKVWYLCPSLPSLFFLSLVCIWLISGSVFYHLILQVYLLVHWVALFVISGGSLMKVLRLWGRWKLDGGARCHSKEISCWCLKCR